MPETSTLYTISPSSESTVAAQVLKGGLMGRHKKLLLIFENYEGELQWSPSDPAPSKLVLTIDAANIVCRDPWLSEKGRRALAAFASQEALHSHIYPEIRFSSVAIAPKPLRGYQVTGTLQILGTTRELKLTLTTNPKRNGQLLLDGDATFRLSGFGLPAPSRKLGLIRTLDEVTIHLLLWALPSRSV